tara:strand:- start:1162 stop:1269 length:108 start_codon:yes stop_codon:yes gene_type:complete
MAFGACFFVLNRGVYNLENDFFTGRVVEIDGGIRL